MKKSFYSRVLFCIFILSLLPVSTSLISCSSSSHGHGGVKNGGQKIHSSGSVGNKRHRNNHVWGK